MYFLSTAQHSQVQEENETIFYWSMIMNVSKIPYISFNICVLKIYLIVEGLYYEAQRTDKTCSFSFHDPELNPEIISSFYSGCMLYPPLLPIGQWH